MADPVNVRTMGQALYLLDGWMARSRAQERELYLLRLRLSLREDEIRVCRSIIAGYGQIINEQRKREPETV